MDSQQVDRSNWQGMRPDDEDGKREPSERAHPESRGDGGSQYGDQTLIKGTNFQEYDHEDMSPDRNGEEE